MTTMHAVRFSTYGPPSVLSVGDIAKPILQPGEALVQVAASAINPSDVKFVSGLFNPTLPRTPGRDYAGIVVTGSPRWAGKAVWGNGAGFGISRDGSHAQFVAVPEDWLSEKPANLSMDQAAAVGVPYIAAWSALVAAGEIRAGETVLVTGASGAVGRAATQIARWKKARVIGADVRESQDSGADVFINTKTNDLPTMVAELSCVATSRCSIRETSASRPPECRLCAARLRSCIE
jgi:NADPH2:quinone reductase